MAEPWIKVKVSLRGHPKMAHLPSDTARLGWVYVLLSAKLQKPLGVFVSRAHFMDVLGRFGRFVDRYITVGLLHRAPELCPECLEVYPDGLQAGMLVVHDYPREQRDPTNADRQSGFRNAHRNGADNGRVTEKVTPLSRARALTVTETVTETEKPPPSVVGFSLVGAEAERILGRIRDGKSA